MTYSSKTTDLEIAIAITIATLIFRSGKSQKQVAEELGASETVLSRLCNCDRELSFSEMDALCTVLGITHAEFLHVFEENKKNNQKIARFREIKKQKADFKTNNPLTL